MWSWIIKLENFLTHSFFFFFGKHVKIALPVFEFVTEGTKDTSSRKYKHRNETTKQQQNTVKKNTIEDGHRKTKERALERTCESCKSTQQASSETP